MSETIGNAFEYVFLRLASRDICSFYVSPMHIQKYLSDLYCLRKCGNLFDEAYRRGDSILSVAWHPASLRRPTRPGPADAAHL